MAEVNKGANKQRSDDINKVTDQSQESIRDNDTTASLMTACTQQTKLSSQNSDQPLTSTSGRTIAECIYGTHGNVLEKCRLRMNGYSGTKGSSSESLDDASHVAVVNQSLYSSSTCQGYMKGEMRLAQNTDQSRPDSLFNVLELDRGYSSNQVEGWV